MRVELWTDIICPWCGIGAKRLEQALARFSHGDEVEVVHRSFQLDPKAREDVVLPVKEMLVKSKGLSAAQVDQMTTRIEALAREDGLVPYVVRDNQVGNTSLAHELAAWAETQGKGSEAWALLYRAYFGEARSIFDVASLVGLATELGLDAEAAREALESRRFAEKVRAEGREAQALGASGVPFFVIDRRYGVAGAQPVEVLVKALEAAWADRRERGLASADAGGAEDAVCGPDGCAVPG